MMYTIRVYMTYKRRDTMFISVTDREGTRMFAADVVLLDAR